MEKRFKKLSVIALLLLAIFMVACSSPAAPDTQTPDDTPPAGQTEPAEQAKGEIILSTTTSTDDSGLLDFILPEFTKDTGYDVKVVAVGTGQALQMGRDGDADVLLVHAKASEEEFIAEGHGVERFDVMYNDFVLLGPKNDSLNLKEKADSNIAEALSIISKSGETFVSRGDDSGTHKKELQIWKESNIEPKGDWYVDAGQGMGAVNQMTDELQGYTMSDRATFLSMRDSLDLDIVVENDPKMFNQYGVIAVDPGKNDKINADGAQAFVDWILSDKAQGLIEEFGKDTYGQSLFIPNA